MMTILNGTRPSMRTVLGAAALAALGLVLNGSLAARVTAQDVAIPLVTHSKAVANRAAAAANVHTAAEQRVDEESSTPSMSSTSSAPVRSMGSPASSMTPITASRPQSGKPTSKPTTTTTPAMSTTTTTTTTTAAPTAAAATKAAKAAPAVPPPGKPALSVASTPATAPGGKPAGAATAKGAAPTATAAATPGGPAAGPPSDSSISVTQRGTKGEVSLNREVYSYDPGARRDPFISLMRSGDLRPMLSDLRLVTVLYDPTGQNSIAVMRDQSTKDQYRVRVGQTLGRMRVAQIQPKQVVFTIEEVGFSRQEALALGDLTKARTQ